MRSVKSSSNQWEDSYYIRDIDESKESRQIDIGTSKALSKRQPNDEASNLKEGTQVNGSTTFKQVNDEVPKATKDNTVKLEEIRIHIKVGNYLNT